MRDPNLKALTVYVDKSVYEAVRVASEAEDRSITNYLSRLISAGHVAELPTSDLERLTGGSQKVKSLLKLADRIHRGPKRVARHK